MQCIGATTLNEYHKHIEKDAALERRFQPVKVGEPTREESVEILHGPARPLRGAPPRSHHRRGHPCRRSTLSDRYISDRFLPDKAIDLIDEAASRVRIKAFTAPPDMKEQQAQPGGAEQGDRGSRGSRGLRKGRAACATRRRSCRTRWPKSAARNGSRRATARSKSSARTRSRPSCPCGRACPWQSMTEGEAQRLIHLEETLHRRVIGQDEAVKAVSACRSPGARGAEGSPSAHRLVHLPGPHRRGQDRAVQGAGRGAVRR